MITVIFATREEAGPFLSTMHLCVDAAQNHAPFPVYDGRLSSGRRPLLRVGVCGMGPTAALAAAAYFLGQDGLAAIFNAGICGALVDVPTYAPGAVFDVLQVRGAPGDVRPWAAATLPLASSRGGLARARLVTVAHPVFDAAQRGRLARVAELVDMEGAPIAWAAARRGIPCRLIKGVSDRAAAGQRKALQRNLKWVSERIAEALTGCLGQWGATALRSTDGGRAFAEDQPGMASRP